MAVKRRILSFKYAGDGIWTALKEEPNLKFHFLAAFLVLFFGFYFNITRVEWLCVLILIGLVITAELTNAAIEAVVDSFTSDVHPGAKKAKDVSAGAVLILAITSIAVGLIIFLPYLINYSKSLQTF